MMKSKWLRMFFLILSVFLISGLVLAAAAATEHEPNDTPAQANDLNSYSVMQGTVDPGGDVDYFKVRGVNKLWGMVAFLDTGTSAASHQGVISAYAPDGVTLLQQDSAAAGRKGVIAWQHFTGSDPHFLRVNEAGDDESISQYSLRYYQLAIGMPGAEHEEQEPNDAPVTANTSARVNHGVIASASDKDCYAVYARKNQTFLYVLNADPEKDGGADFALALYNPDGSLWRNADRAGAGGNEYIDEVNIPADGVYVYCISARSGSGPTATYLGGPIVDARGYEPGLNFYLNWDNARPGFLARPGDEMHYTITFSYTDPLNIPDEFHLHINYHPECQEIIDAGNPDYNYGDSFGWRYDGLMANTSIVKTFVMRAKARCSSDVTLDAGLTYYDTGWGKYSEYTIGDGYYLPLVVQ